MRIEVDRKTCIGAGVCLAEAYDTFGVGEDQLVYIKDPQGNIGEAIQKAAEGCPVCAIHLIDSETGAKIFPKE